MYNNVNNKINASKNYNIYWHIVILEYWNNAYKTIELVAKTMKYYDLIRGSQFLTNNNIISIYFNSTNLALANLFIPNLTLNFIHHVQLIYYSTFQIHYNTIHSIQADTTIILIDAQI